MTPDTAAASPADDGFASRLIAWQAVRGRHHLPWQGDRDPYRIWVSEIMLQQTQVSAVIPYYQRFMARFPEVAALAAAPLDAVLAHWSGLGYYARARNLHRAALEVMSRHGGRFPTASVELAALPGIGRSTAAAIAAFAAGERSAILDGNVKRVLARHFAVPGFPGASAVERQLWALAESLLPEQGIEAYTQGLMDLGATVCTRSRPGCGDCPVVLSCQAHAAGAVSRYPAARPVRARPERSATLWLVHDGPPGTGRVLLERRPPAGIWGGLWSLPEQLPPQLEVDSATAGPALRLSHGFTHFILHITVEQRCLSLAAARLQVAEAQAGLAWHPWREVLTLGLPAPIRTVLEHLSAPAPAGAAPLTSRRAGSTLSKQD